MKEKLILLERKYPIIYEIHKNEINQSRNLIISTADKEFAQDLVKAYNKYKNE